MIFNANVNCLDLYLRDCSKYPAVYVQLDLFETKSIFTHCFVHYRADLSHEMLSCPRVGLATRFGSYYKSVLRALRDPQLASSIIHVIIQFVSLPPNYVVVYEGEWDFDAPLDAMEIFPDLSAWWNLTFSVYSRDGIDVRKRPNKPAHCDRDSRVSISMPGESPFFPRCAYFIENCVSSPLFAMTLSNQSAFLWFYQIKASIRRITNPLISDHECYDIANKAQSKLLDGLHLIISHQPIHILSGFDPNSDPNSSLNSDTFPDDNEVQRITRQFHDCAFDRDSNQLIVFGGYGTNLQSFKSSTSKLSRKRLNDSLHFEYDPLRKSLVSQMVSVSENTNSVPIPKKRQHHSTVMLKNGNQSVMFLFGGRSNPYKAFGDFWMYHIEQRQWREVKGMGYSYL